MGYEEQLASHISNIFSFCFQIAIIIFSVIAISMTLNKLGKPGWSIIIPFYNLYILNKVAKLSNIWFIFGMICTPGIYFGLYCMITGMYSSAFQTATSADDIAESLRMINEIGPDIFWPMMTVMLFITLLSYLFYTIWFTVAVINYSRLFKKSFWFALGLLCVPYIFIGILAFDKRMEYSDDDNLVNDIEVTSKIF